MQHIKESVQINQSQIPLRTLFFTSGVVAGSLLAWAYLKRKSQCSDFYGMGDMLSNYLVLHYGTEDEQMCWPNGPISATLYPKRCIDYLMSNVEFEMKGNALDVGCAVGRSTFELSKYFEKVDGLDYGEAFISKCNQMKLSGYVDYKVVSEGHIMINHKACLPDGSNADRVNFYHGDACKDIAECIRKNSGNQSEPQLYDCVVAFNLIDRLVNPYNFLAQLRTLVKPGGYVMLTSPYTWLEQFTPKANWIGGWVKSTEDGDKAEDTHDNLIMLMKSMNFDVVKDDNLTFLFRRTRRMHEWTVASTLIFRKRL